MNVENTRLVFFAIASVMGLVWLVGVRFALGRLRPPRSEDDFQGYGTGYEDVVTGEAVIEGDPETLSKKITEQFISSGPLGAGMMIKVAERTAGRIRFERGKVAGRGSIGFDSGEITLVPEGTAVRVRYTVGMESYTRMMKILTYAICLGFGGLVLIGTPLAVWFFVVKNENPAVRWQVFQTFQMVHGVWPPFLIGFISPQVRRLTAAYFDTLLANLQHAA